MTNDKQTHDGVTDPDALAWLENLAKPASAPLTQKQEQGKTVWEKVKQSWR